MEVVTALWHISGRTAVKVSMTVFILLLAAPVPLSLVGAVPTDTGSPEPGSTRGSSSIQVDPDDAARGYTLVAPFNRKAVYLVDSDGNDVHTWQNDDYSTGPVEILPDGTLLRGITVQGKPDRMRFLDWDSRVLWDYAPPSPYRLHHDFEVMPNGNILFNVGIGYNYTQMVALGRDPTITPGALVVEPIIEVKPNGTKGGDIVWMWDPLDHITQDFDPTKPNFGVVSEHPELLDINYPREYYREWQHTNTVSYNAELDQIMVTSRNFDELWVIDHNTTMTEAAGHTGGAHGMGGDIIYRWGNPRAYDAGTESDHILWGPHDAQWIDPGLPGEGNIIVFNNGQNMYTVRPEGRYSTVEELVPPVNASGGYDRTPGSAFGPSDSAWRFNASPPEDFFGPAMGGVQRLPDGNTLVSGGSNGCILEVDPEGNIVWNYTTQSLFKARRYYPPSLEAIPDLMATEDLSLKVDLSGYLSDLDTGVSDLVLKEGSKYATVSGHELVLRYPDGILSDVFEVSVSDGMFEAGVDVRVNITPVNDPPQIKPIPAVRAMEEVPSSLDLRDFVTDPDTVFGMMTIEEDSPYVTVDECKLTFLYPEGVLTDRVHLTVSDGEYEVEAEITVLVTPVNDPPSVDRIPDQRGVEDVPWILDLREYVHDVDSPLEAITVTTSSSYIIITGLEVRMLYPDGVTEDMVYLTVTDGEGGTVTELHVTIEPVNDPPVIEELPRVTVKEDESFSLDIGESISDVDTPVEELHLAVVSAYVQVAGDHLVLRYPEGILQDEVIVEVWDGDLHASTTLHVTIEPVNDPPWWSALPDLVAVEDVEGEMDLGPFMNDTDTPVKELKVRSSSAYGTVEGHVFRYTYPDGVLQESVAFTLSDGEFSATATMDITVMPVNDPPELMEAKVKPHDGGREDRFKFSVVLKDVDTGPRAPQVEVVIDGVPYECSIDDSGTHPIGEGVTYVVEAELGPGVHDFYFLAEDGDGGEATTDPLTFSVSKEPERADGPSRLAILICSLIAGAALVVLLVLVRSRKPRVQTE